MNALISIIVPAFNRGDLIIETLESVRRQTYTPIQLIVVDDGSSDETVRNVSEWLSAVPEVNCTLIQLGENRGKSAAVNAGIRQVQGAYVMVLDSDDVLFFDALEQEVRFLQDHPRSGLVCARAVVMKGRVKTKTVLGGFDGYGDFESIREVYGDLLLRGNAVIASTVLMRREVVDRVGPLNTSLRYTQDWEYWIRAAKAFEVGFLSKPILYYRIQAQGSLSANKTGFFSETITLLQSAASTTSRTTMGKAIVYQTKYYCWLSYHEGDSAQMMKIVVLGVRALLGMILGRR